MTPKPALAIVGAHGYIGTILTQLAGRTSHDVRSVVRSPANSDRVTIAFEQFIDRLAVNREPVTIVWLLAGAVHREDAQLARLLAAVSPAHTRLVYASSCAVYGRTDRLADEQFPLSPRDTYAKTKARCEALLAKSDLSHCVLRLATVHGHPTGGAPKQSVHRLLRQAANGHVSLYGADNWRPFIGVNAAARVLLRAADATALSGTFNVAHEHATFGVIARYAARRFASDISPSGHQDRRSYRVSIAAATETGLLKAGDDPGLWASMDQYSTWLEPIRTT